LPALPKRNRGRKGESTEAEMEMAKVAKPKLKPTSIRSEMRRGAKERNVHGQNKQPVVVRKHGVNDKSPVRLFG
jgi:hypothetical protein